MRRKWILGVVVAIVAGVGVFVALFDVGSGPAPAGFTLASVAVTLPADDARFPAGNAALDANCASCHSPSMVLSQPPLTAEQWRAEVKKMREVYKAPVAERDVPEILRALSTISARGRSMP